MRLITDWIRARRADDRKQVRMKLARRPGDRVLHVSRHRPEHIQVRPHVLPRAKLSPPLVLASGFAVLIAFGSVLLALPWSTANGEWAPPLTALFTAASAVCITGLVVVDTGTYFSSFGHVIILLLIQIGGLGFMSTATLLLLAVGRRVSLRERIVAQEALGAGGPGSVLRLIRRVALFSFATEAIGALLLFPVFRQDHPNLQAAWVSLFHSVSAFNNAGFDILGDFRSLTAYSGSAYLLLVVASLIILGGLSYFVVEEVAQRRSFTRLSLNARLVLLLSAVLWVLGALAVLAGEMTNPNTLGPLAWPDKVVNAFFLSVTARSCGFSAVPTDGLAADTLIVIAGLMFIGGASASTAGGIKVNSLAALAISIVSTARGRPFPQAFRRTVPQQVVNRALVVTVVSLMVLYSLLIAFSVFENRPFLPLLFDAVSAVGTVGLSTGIIPDLSPASQVTVIITMYFGRVGPLTIVLALIGRARPPRVRYADDTVRIG